MKKIIEEFKQFISKGNVLDLAVGVIIGTAFSKIVTSLVNDMIMPLLGVITGGNNLSNLSLKIKDANIAYGAFLQNVIDFLLMAICVFIIVKIVNKIKTNLEKLNPMKKEKEDSKEEKKEEPKKSSEEKLLEEIRDLLKENKKNEVSKVSKKK